MPITVKSNRVQQPFDATVSVKWLCWMPLGLAVLINVVLAVDLMAGWVITALVGYAAVLIGLSYAYQHTAARVAARVLVLLLPIAWLALLVAVLWVGEGSIAAQVSGQDGWLGQALEYCLFQSCVLLLPFWAMAQAGLGFMASRGRKFDNNLLRVFSAVTAVLLAVACFHFDEKQYLSIFGTEFRMVYAIKEPLFHTLLFVAALAVAVLSFVVFPPFADKIRKQLDKKGAEKK